MAKPIEWESEIYGQMYQFSYQKKKGEHILSINGQELQPHFSAKAVGDYFGMAAHNFWFYDKNATLIVSFNGQPDIVIDGVRVRTGKRWVKTPGWTWVFIGLLVPLLFLGGAIGGMIGAVAAGLVVSVSQKAMSTVARVFICIGVLISAWGVQSVLANVLLSLIGR